MNFVYLRPGKAADGVVVVLPFLRLGVLKDLPSVLDLLWTPLPAGVLVFGLRLFHRLPEGLVLLEEELDGFLTGPGGRVGCHRGVAVGCSCCCCLLGVPGGFPGALLVQGGESLLRLESGLLLCLLPGTFLGFSTGLLLLLERLVSEGVAVGRLKAVFSTVRLKFEDIETVLNDLFM